MEPVFAPSVAPLAQPVTPTHRVITCTCPSTLLRTGDSLYRLITATYSSGEYYHYTYDAVGNRQSLTTHEGVVNYQYDAANRLTSVNGQTYNWDDNGNPSTGSGQACSRTACVPTPTTTLTASPRW
jgi:YD repeat-containing protein